MSEPDPTDAPFWDLFGPIEPRPTPEAMRAAVRRLAEIAEATGWCELAQIAAMLGHGLASAPRN